MKSYGTLGIDEPPTPDELKFLDIIPQVEWLPEEIEKLNEPTTEQEVYDILRFETDLDSAPGEDGLTSRALWTFWNFPAFRWLFIGFLNYTRFDERFVQTGNIGIMVVKNKKSQSIDYNKKRKLTKINKDSNIGNGKVWANRLKKL